MASTASAAKLNRVFISHGKQKAIVGQIKELLTFGSFEPVVSVERESTAIPVPEKVFEDMLYDEYSKKMSKSAGFDLADNLYKQMAFLQNLPKATV